MKRLTKKQTRIILHTVVIGLLALLIGLMITTGEQTFMKKYEDESGEDFVQQFRAFYVPLTHYLFQPSFLFGITAAAILYTWMLCSLFYKYFNMFKIGRMFDRLLNPRAIESIPHSLIILTIYYGFLKNAAHLRTIMMIPFLVISIPFIYKILENAFLTAQKEGLVENYLVLPIRDRRIIVSFLKQKFLQVLVIPFAFLIILMVYWEFLYSSIGIIIDRKSAAAAFYSSYNSSLLKNFPEPHNLLILLQIGIFTTAVALLLYIVYTAKGVEHE